jgi:CRISPR-associated protein Csd2
MQLTFARSIDPILPSEIAITRVAITKEGENKETEMGRKASVPYGLYLGRGFYSPMLALDTGVSEDDLRLFWTAVLGMFENDRSAARGYMELKGVYVFRHENKLGDAPSGPLFSRIKVSKKDNVANVRSFDQYSVTIDDQDLPEGVSLIKLIG